MLIDALKPVFNIAKSLSVCDIKSHNNSIRLLVEGVSDGAKSLLTCRVPYLHRYRITLWGLKCRVHIIQPNCSHVILNELLVLVPTMYE